MPSAADETLEDTISILSLASHDLKEDENDDGSIKRSLEMNPKRLYFGTRMVNTEHLGEAVVAYERILQKAKEAIYYTTPKRAKVIKDLLTAMYEQYLFGLDSKSSETRRDGKNNQASLVHLLRKQSVEHEYVTKNEASKKLLAGLFGTKQPDED